MVKNLPHILKKDKMMSKKVLVQFFYRFLLGFTIAVFIHIMWSDTIHVYWPLDIIIYLVYVPPLLDFLNFELITITVLKSKNIGDPIAIFFHKTNRLAVFIFSLFAIFCTTLLLFSYFYLPWYIEKEAKKNKVLLGDIIDDIIQNATNDVEKTKAILRWFDRTSNNMNNIYIKNNKLLLKIYPLHIYSEHPWICIRLIGTKNPLWVLTSRCGACMEYSLLFREMANAANLTVRSIHNPGEDHNWDEVYIDGKWIIVDPTRVDLLFNKTGFNLSSRDYEEGRNLNISYVYAEYPNGAIEDVTYRYTNLSNLKIITTDERGKRISNVTVFIFSNNLKRQIDTQINCTTNINGECFVKIGGGNYTLKARKYTNLLILFGETHIITYENKNVTFKISLKQDIFKTINLKFTESLGYERIMFLFLILLWFSIGFYLVLNPYTAICERSER